MRQSTKGHQTRRIGDEVMPVVRASRESVAAPVPACRERSRMVMERGDRVEQIELPQPSLYPPTTRNRRSYQGDLSGTVASGDSSRS